MRYILKNIPRVWLGVAALLPAALHGQESAEKESVGGGVFTLGQITVTGDELQDVTSDNRASADEIWLFNATTLREAVLLVPGVTSTFVTAGRRNETDINVRGFDRWRVPLSIDGIRVYLPADNRLDMSRFLTPDLAEVQVSKGYVSVIDGPGAMGGAINLVTRKPTREFEADFQAGAFFDGDASYQGWMGTAVVGTRQDKWYLQGSYTTLERDQWRLSDDFTPVSAAQGSGDRMSSFNTDWRVNFKAGFTPNETDEYSLSYTKQSGEKGAPLNVNFFPPNPPNSFWTWPFWDVQSLYWLSHTGFGENTYLKTKLYYNKFDNALYAWDDITYSSQSANGRFRSYYNDESYGVSVEVGTRFFDRGQTRAAVHWRDDRHVEFNVNRPTHPTLASTEPEQHTEERTWSLAVEQTWEATETVELMGGISYDANDLRRAQEYNATVGLFEFPTGGSSAFNWQVGSTWGYADNAQFGANISSRTRFPTNFERFSTRFGTAIPNPDLNPERAVNYEISWRAAPADGVSINTALFYSDVRDMIQTVIVQSSPQLTQTQNVGNGSFYGVEGGVDWRLSQAVQFGANYTYTHREITDALIPNLRPVGVPDHFAFAWLAWTPVVQFTVRPSLEVASNRWSDQTGSTDFVRTGAYELVNLQLEYRPTGSIELILGGRNLFDQNFELAAGYPEPGRSVFAKARMLF